MALGTQREVFDAAALTQQTIVVPGFSLGEF
jgi:hypothetical protein